MTSSEIDEKIEELHAEYKKNGGDIDIYYRRVRALEIAKELLLRKDPQTTLFKLTP